MSSAKPQTIEATAESDLAQACERARAQVAERPEDQAAASALREAVQRYAAADPRDPSGLPEIAGEVAEARELLAAGKVEEAEILLRQHLKTHRREASAMHSMAEIAAICDLPEDADRILRESARIHSASADAWIDLGLTLYKIALRTDQPELVHRAVAALDEAIALEPTHEAALTLKASMLAQTRGLDQALATYERLLRLNPHVAMHWVNYGFLLKTLGRYPEGLAAYRTALALDPSSGTAWWGLANLKISRFTDADVRAMRSALTDSGTADAARVEISFALAKALDQEKQFEAAMQLMKDGGKLRTAIQIPETDIVTGGIQFVRDVFTREFFDARRGWGNPSPDPIFILGMPRAGSTLVEQILASHPSVEGTEELFILHQFSTELATRFAGKSSADIIRGLTEADVARFGARYLEMASRSRRTDRPFFTDKNPTNWRHIGLICCMLPNARIIDVRRNPMDCCFANYAQHYQAGYNFSYDQAALGRYYGEYVEIMRHFDAVLPGRVHRLIHDDLVDNFEGEVRRLLEYLGLPFDDACLRFYETKRAIHTPSSEQVRQPINRSGFGKWRNYETWLGELKDALGDALDNWRS